MPREREGKSRADISRHERIDWLLPVLGNAIDMYRKQHGLLRPNAAGDRLFCALIEECRNEASRTAAAAIRATDRALITLSADAEERLGPNPDAAVQKGPIKKPSAIASKWSGVNNYAGRHGWKSPTFSYDDRSYRATMTWSYQKRLGGVFLMQWHVFNVEDGAELTLAAEPPWLLGEKPGVVADDHAAKIAADVERLLTQLHRLPYVLQRGVVASWQGSLAIAHTALGVTRATPKIAVGAAKAGLVLLIVGLVAIGGRRAFPNSAFAEVIRRLEIRVERVFSPSSIQRTGEALDEATEGGRKPGGVTSSDAHGNTLRVRQDQRSFSGHLSVLDMKTANFDKDVREYFGRLPKVSRKTGVIEGQMLITSQEPMIAVILVIPEQRLEIGDQKSAELSWKIGPDVSAPWTMTWDVKSDGPGHVTVDKPFPYVMKIGSSTIYAYMSSITFERAARFRLIAKLDSASGTDSRVIEDMVEVDEDGKVSPDAD
ncbi:MAG TPA: hypothetical protein VNM92_12105 [Thermoanaerobaculia bacterium]|nr:hypothetical protein [Thermoanaerobaculia bacterium]